MEVEVSRDPQSDREAVPRRFWFASAEGGFENGEHIDVSEVLDRWLAPDHRYFKVRDRRGDIYILRDDVATGRWELTFFQRGST